MRIEMSQTFLTLIHSQITSLNLLLSVRNSLRKSSFYWLNLYLQTSQIIESLESSKWYSTNYNCLWQALLKRHEKQYNLFHTNLISHAACDWSCNIFLH